MAASPLSPIDVRSLRPSTSQLYVYTDKTNGVWLRATLLSVADKAGDALLVRLANAPPTSPGIRVEADKATRASDAAQKGLPDMAQLDILHEAALLENIEARYKRGDIYTACGSLLVSVNPYKNLPLYSDEVITRYIEAGRSDARAVARSFGAGGSSASRHAGTILIGALGGSAPLPPHLFGLAECALSHMARTGGAQMILISGESGAGKTEGTKYLLRYLMSRSIENTDALPAGIVGPGSGDDDDDDDGSGASLEHRILLTNPVLEAYGNAMTLKNANSSRFGKLFRLAYSPTPSGGIGGESFVRTATIQSYLLEKSRAAVVPTGERSFHALYMLCRGADPATRAALGLHADPSKHVLLNQGGVVDIAGVDDAAQFTQVNEALSMLRVEDAAISALNMLTAAVIHLGDVEFAESPDGEGSPCILRNDASRKACEFASKLLGVPGLEKLLVTKAFTGGGRSAGSLKALPLSRQEAEDSKRALIRFVYSCAFQYVVARVNDSIHLAKQGIPRRGSRATSPDVDVGILDIFGFEVFKENGFETLCINYANEKLHSVFVQSFFKTEVEMMEAEGVEVPTDLTYQDNQPCLDLLEMRNHGIIDVLHEECTIARSTAQSLANKIKSVCSSSKYYRNAHPRNGPTAFVIVHYAGDVTYHTNGFIDRNRDLVRSDVRVALEASSDPHVSACLKLGGSHHLHHDGEPNKRMKTVATEFRNSLAELFNLLSSARTHFVRCIKPNSSQSSDMLERSMVLDQMRYSGLQDLIRVRLSVNTFGHRLSYIEACELYTNAPASCIETSRAVVKKLLADRRMKENVDYKLGRTILFCKDSEFVEFLEMRPNAALVIQKCYRMFVQRKAYEKRRSAGYLVMFFYRRRMLRRRLFAYVEASWVEHNRRKGIEVAAAKRKREDEEAARVEAERKAAAEKAEAERKAAAERAEAERKAAAERAAADAAKREEEMRKAQEAERIALERARQEDERRMRHAEMIEEQAKLRRELEEMELARRDAAEGSANVQAQAARERGELIARAEALEASRNDMEGSLHASTERVKELEKELESVRGFAANMKLRSEELSIVKEQLAEEERLRRLAEANTNELEGKVLFWKRMAEDASARRGKFAEAPAPEIEPVTPMSPGTQLDIAQQLVDARAELAKIEAELLQQRRAVEAMESERVQREAHYAQIEERQAYSLTKIKEVPSVGSAEDLALSAAQRSTTPLRAGAGGSQSRIHALEAVVLRLREQLVTVEAVNKSRLRVATANGPASSPSRAGNDGNTLAAAVARMEFWRREATALRSACWPSAAAAYRNIASTKTPPQLDSARRIAWKNGGSPLD